jgi:hypothetical protein
LVKILHNFRMTRNEFSILGRIYRTVWYSPWLNFTIPSYMHAHTQTHTRAHTHTHTSVRSQVFTSRYSVAASNGGRSPSSPRLQLPNYQSHSSQRLNWSSLLNHSLTHQLTTSLHSTQLNWLYLESVSELLYDWQFPASQFVLAPSPLSHWFLDYSMSYFYCLLEWRIHCEGRIVKNLGAVMTYFKLLSQRFPGWTDKTMKHLSQYSQ